MSSQTISIENKTDEGVNYAIFMDPPEFSGGEGSYMNVWLTSYVHDNNSFDITTGEDYSAWVGTVPCKPSAGVLVSSGKDEKATLGTAETSGSTFDMTVTSEQPSLTKATASAAAGAYEIKTGTDFAEPNETYLVGLAMADQDGYVVPVASEITPKFYVVKSYQEPGEIVDYDATIKDAATVDFSSGDGVGNSYGRVTHGADGEFTVVYF